MLKDCNGNKLKMWVITAEINECYQEGEYFVSAFIEKPTIEQLKETIPGKQIDFYQHLLDGGGRTGHEDTWYNFRQITFGVNYFTP